MAQLTTSMNSYMIAKAHIKWQMCCVTLLLCMLSGVSFAQIPASSKKEAKKLVIEAKQDWQQAMFARSFKLFKKAAGIDPQNRYADFRTGEIYFLSDSAKIKALPYLLSAIKYSPASMNDTVYTAYFYIAHCYMLEGQYDSAIQSFQQYESHLGSARVNKEVSSSIERDIQICKAAPALLQRKTDSASYLINGKVEPLEVYNMGDSINSQYPEYAQVFLNNDENTMIFTSRRPTGKSSEVDDITGKYFENMYTSTRDNNGQWTSPVLYNRQVHLRTKDLYTATVAISTDQSMLFSYRDGGILESKKTNGEWSEPQRLSKYIPELKDSYVPSIFLSNDGKILLIVSDLDGGYGHKDIYMCTLDKDGNWSKIQNLGPAINTADEEDAPFLLPDNKTLFFSSKGHGGLGGYDVFVSHYDSGKWSAPQNLGAPINSPGDDIYFTYSDKESRGYFSSSRLGGYGDMDIYSFTITKPVIDTTPKTKPVPVANADTENILNRIAKLPSCIVYFKLAKYDLDKKYYPALDSVIAYMKENKKLRIFVNGYTCSIGDLAYNQDLGLLRASSVASYFFSHGIAFDRIVYAGYGKTNYVAPNDGIHNYLNRRTEVYQIVK